MARTVSTLQRISLAPVIGAMFGMVAAVLVAATPAWLFVRAIGVPPILPMRLIAIVAAFAVAGVVIFCMVWAAERVFAVPATRESDELDLATFDAAIPISDPVRRPISAVELGAPLMSDEALQTIRPLTIDEPGMPKPEPVVEAETRDPADSQPPLAERASIDALIARLEAGMARQSPPTPPNPSGSTVTPSPTTGSTWIVREGDANDHEPSAILRRILAG